MATIADILIAKGNAQAEAARTRGNTYADLIRNLSSIPGQVVQQTRADNLYNQRLALEQGQQQLQQQELAQGQQKLDIGARQQHESAVLDQLWSDPEVYTPDGTINRAGLQKRLAAGQMGHLAPAALETADRLDESRAQLLKRQQDLAESYRETLGKDALELDKAGNDPGIFHLIVADRAKTGVIQPRQAEELLKADTPDAVAAITARWKAGSAAGKPNLEKLGKDEVLIDKNNPAGPPVAVGPKGTPNEVELALQATGGDPGAALNRLKPQTPRPIAEQLLEAVAAGDTKKAGQITTTMRMEAEARKDPAAASMARELGSLRADEARARLDKMKEDAKPIDISPDVQTTMSGKKYIDASLYTGNERNKAVTAAGTSGVVPVSKEQADSIKEIDNARSNQRDILAQLDGVLPTNPLKRAGALVATPIEKLLQTDTQKAAFNTWRSAAINTLRATAGSKGLRITKSELDMAIENDIPKLTDTAAVAQQKVKNINALLDNAENSILVRDRSVPVQPTGPPQPPALTPGLQGLADR